MKSKIRNNALKVSILFLALIAMVVGMALPAMAQSTFGPAAKLSFGTQPVGANGGAAFSTQPVVIVQDAGGNTVTNSSAFITLAIGNNPSGGTLSGIATATAVNGVASFSGLSIDKAGTYTLTAASTGLTGVASNSFNITVGPAAKLAFTTQPGGAVRGGLLNPQPVVTVQDAGGNTITGSAASIALAFGTNPSNGILSGSATVTAVNGVAAFSGLSIDKVGTGYTLLASSAGLATATSNTFNITAQTPPPSTPGTAIRTVQGKVLSVGANQFVVQTGDNNQVTVNVDGNTSYFLVNTGKSQSYVNNKDPKENKESRENKNGKVPPGLQKKALDLKNARIPAHWRDDLGWLGNFNKQAQFSDIQVGDRVIARVTNDTASLAKQVLIIKAPVIQQVKGIITAVSTNPNTITITPQNGAAVTLNWDTSTRFILKGTITLNGHMATAVYNRNSMITQLVNVLPAAP